MTNDGTTFEDKYSDSGFWSKVTEYAKTAGSEVIEKALWLYYAAQGKDTPVSVKATIYSALGYFILPLDVIPDAIPVVGFTDDLGVLGAALLIAAAHIDEEVKGKAAQKMKDWFG